RIETWRRTREPNSADGVTKDGSYRVAERVHDAEGDRAEIEKRPQPTHIPKCESRECGEHQDAERESGQPFSELECGHRPEPESCPKRKHRWVVHREKTSQGFVGDVQGERYPQHHPRDSEPESSRSATREPGGRHRRLREESIYGLLAVRQEHDLAEHSAFAQHLVRAARLLKW